MTSTIEPHTPDGDAIIVGQAFMGFLDRVAPPAARKALSEDAIAILKQASVSATEHSERVGLIVGRIQSGKTVSYEGLIALARDNGFALVVVLSGISRPLLTQGHRRLTGDLSRADPTGWKFFTNAGLDPLNESELRSVRDNWADAATPSQLKKTAVCLLLKHYGRIGDFAELCKQIGWGGLKVLIIDDEADQASLNTRTRRGLESPTYHNILQLKSVFLNHAYIQYTATPQAPLLIAITDSLSPDFVRVLEPGPAYVGGSDFFGSSNSLVESIPQGDLTALTIPAGAPPVSLVKAYREFVLGAASELSAGRSGVRSMLVHPSRTTDLHERFVNWVRQVKNFWSSTIESDEPADVTALRSEFEATHAGLAATATDIEPFEKCWPLVKYVLRNLQIIEMNTRDGQTPEFDWVDSTAYVLIGGQAIDRGFTVEGLSVTYMPRDSGTGTADSLQQRARFFGYKRSYIGLCRVYLEPVLRVLFERYVAHEASMIDSLRRIAAGELTLKAWRRSFLLDSNMRPTRANVIGVQTISVSPGETWLYDNRPPRVDSYSTGVAALDAFLEGFDGLADAHGNVHYTLTIPELLTLLETVPDDFASKTAQMTALELQLAPLVDSDPGEAVRFIRMRSKAPTSIRSLSGGRVQPFEGRSASYKGDRLVYEDDSITLQAHFFSVRVDRTSAPFGSRLVLAFRVPARLADQWIIEAD